MFLPISAFLLFFVSEVACDEKSAHFATIKKLSKNLSACIILVLYATFVQNLTFLGLLSPEISFGERTVTHPPRESLFRHPETQDGESGAIRNNSL